MEDQTTDTTSSDRGSAGGRGASAPVAEPVRSRWTPKPEQILILESIFNSGMVNPPKDETVRIRKLLEKFGPVGDANVFYWFQNRRSRSRRRQRQMQAGLAGDPRTTTGILKTSTGAIPYEATPSGTSTSSSSNNSLSGGFVSGSATDATTTNCCSSSFMADDGADDLFSISRQMVFPEIIDQGPIFSPAGASSLHNYQPAGFITVFINGIAQEVPRGPIDMRDVFGQDMMLVHSSGELVPMSDYGILFQGLHAGESYFLVPRHSV